MEFLKIILFSLSSILALFVFTKLIGNKQISQLNMFDYVNGITIGSIAAEMATSLDGDFWKPLLSMLIYTLVSLLISFLTMKSTFLRRIIDGKSIIIFNNGKLYHKNLLKGKMTINEFQIQCRKNGYFNLSDIQTAVLETNGSVTFLPVTNKRPVTPEDLNLNLQKEKFSVNVILNGKVLNENLKYTGNNEKWLNDELHKLGISNASEVTVAICKDDNTLEAYKNISQNFDNDFFQ